MFWLKKIRRLILLSFCLFILFFTLYLKMQLQIEAYDEKKSNDWCSGGQKALKSLILSLFIDSQLFCPFEGSGAVVRNGDFGRVDLMGRHLVWYTLRFIRANEEVNIPFLKSPYVIIFLC